MLDGNYYHLVLTIVNPTRAAAPIQSSANGSTLRFSRLYPLACYWIPFKGCATHGRALERKKHQPLRSAPRCKTYPLSNEIFVVLQLSAVETVLSEVIGTEVLGTGRLALSFCTSLLLRPGDLPAIMKITAGTFRAPVESLDFTVAAVNSTFDYFVHLECLPKNSRGV